jgi:hypothetical protein
MLPLAHTGLTVAVTIIIKKLGKPRTTSPKPSNVRFIYLVLFALLPDIIDHPLGIFVLPQFHTCHLIAHSLLFLLCLLLIILFVRPSKVPYGLACMLHLILDHMWDSPHTLFFPFLGLTFDSADTTMPTFCGYLRNIPLRVMSSPTVLIGEVTGLAILVFVFFLGKKRLSDLNIRFP